MAQKWHQTITDLKPGPNVPDCSTTHALQEIVHGLGLCDVRQHAVPLVVVEADFDKVEVDLDDVGRCGAVVPRSEVVPLGVTVEVDGGGGVKMC